MQVLTQHLQWVEKDLSNAHIPRRYKHVWGVNNRTSLFLYQYFLFSCLQNILTTFFHSIFQVCQDTYPDMEGLANHMIVSGHHKKQVLRSHNYPELGLRHKQRKRFLSDDQAGSTVASLHTNTADFLPGLCLRLDHASRSHGNTNPCCHALEAPRIDKIVLKSVRQGFTWSLLWLFFFMLG